MTITTKEERDSIRFDKTVTWKGRGYCQKCNNPISRNALKCHSCTLKRIQEKTCILRIGVSTRNKLRYLKKVFGFTTYDELLKELIK